MLEFTVLGVASPKGSTKSFIPKRKDGSLVTRADGRPKVVTTNAQGAKGKVWSARVSGRAFEEMVTHDLKLVRHAPMVIEVEFYLPRPKAHYRTGRFAHVLRDDAPAVPSTMPDVDKLIRGVLDALTNVVYGDDGQIVRAVGTKHYGDPARAEIRLARYAAEREPALDDAQMTLAA